MGDGATADGRSYPIEEFESPEGSPVEPRRLREHLIRVKGQARFRATQSRWLRVGGRRGVPARGLLLGGRQVCVTCHTDMLLVPPGRALCYCLSVSGLPQQLRDSEHEQAPCALSAQDLSTSISNPQAEQT